MDEIASIKSEIELLTTRLAALENASKQEAQSGGDQVAFGTEESSPIEIAKLRAFDVTCDGRENDPWLIYLPSGCISYAGFEPDEIDPAPDDTTRLADLGTAIKDGGIYAHLYLELDDEKVTGFQKLEIDTTPAQTPTGGNIKIVNIKIATITDGSISQNVSSSLILEGDKGDAAPLPWDVKVENGEAMIFSPYFAVLKSGASKSKQIEIVRPDGYPAGEWTRVQVISSGGGIYGRLYVSTSSSGVNSYTATIGTAVSGSACLYQVNVANIKRNEESEEREVTSATQLFHGLPTILDLGIADRKSISLNDEGETEIKGFKDGASETTKLSDHLTAESEFEGQVLVRKEVNGEKVLIFVPIGSGIGGGGGGTSGYDGTLDVATGNIRCNEASGYYIQNEYKTWTFEKGLLKSISEDAFWSTGIATTELSKEPQ